MGPGCHSHWHHCLFLSLRFDKLLNGGPDIPFWYSRADSWIFTCCWECPLGEAGVWTSLSDGVKSQVML